MKKTLLHVLAGIAIGVMVMLIFNHNRVTTLKNKLDGYSKVPDTVYVHKTYTPKKEYKFTEPPRLIFMYFNDTVKVKEEIQSIVVQKDTLKLFYKDSTYQGIDLRFLTTYPNTDRLIQLLLDNKNLDLSLLNTSGNIYKKEFKINTDIYHYNYYNGKLTYKKKPFYKKFGLAGSFTFRPKNELYDLDLALKYKTSLFNYYMGVNFFYYPKYQTALGKDLFFRVTYDW